jgi:hypothetical protein
VSLTAGNAQMAHQALRGVPVCQSAGLEAGPMRVDSPAHRGVACHAVTLGVAGGTALQPLPLGAAMLQQPEDDADPSAATKSDVVGNRPHHHSADDHG